MQRKRTTLIIPLISASLLTGCAAQATDRYAPAPQALIEAAEQASQMRMVYADIQARANGHTVESVRLDARDADAPDFMRASVRLDYNGPMENVLKRVGNDIGYRLNEYSKPASGLSWTPWIRLSGNKSLLDHMREMNSQVPWHIVLDHRNRRLVVDYSDDGGMASQIMTTREKLRNTSSYGSRNLPTDGRAINDRTQKAVAETLSNQPALPHAEPRPNLPPREVWFLAIEGYETRAQARAMVVWLAKIDVDSYVHEDGANAFDVRVIAKTSRDAVTMRELLKENQVPSELGYEEPENDKELKRRAEQAMRDGWPIDALKKGGATSKPYSMGGSSVTSSSSESSLKPYSDSQSQATTSSPTRSSDSKPATSTSSGGGSYVELAKASIVNSLEAGTIKRTHWTVQLAHSKNMSGMGYGVSKIEEEGFDAAILPYRGRMHQLRAVGFDSRREAGAALRKLKKYGYADAYVLAPEGE